MKWQTIHRLHRELTDDQRAVVKRCLAHLPDEPVETTSELWRLYEAGDLGMFALCDEAAAIQAAVFFRVDQLATGSRDFSLFGACSATSGMNAIQQALPDVEAAARRIGCDSMSLRTTRPGMVSLMQALGWFPAEIVMRKGLA